jgi:hypothetical protein
MGLYPQTNAVGTLLDEVAVLDRLNSGSFGAGRQRQRGQFVHLHPTGGT